MSIFEKLNRNNKIEVPSPVQSMYQRAKNDVFNSSEYRDMRKTGPVEVLQQQAFYMGEMGKLGIGTGLDAAYVKSIYYSELIKSAFCVAERGGSLAVRLGEVSQDIARISDPNKDMGDRAVIALNLCGQLLDGRKNSNLGRMAKDFPIIFEPWIGLISTIYGKRKEIIRTINSLDKAKDRSKSALEKTGKNLQNSSSKIVEMAAQYDQNIGLFDIISKSRDRAATLGEELTLALMTGNRQVTDIASKMVKEKENLASVAGMAIKSNESLEGVMEESNKFGTDALAVHALVSVHRAIIVSHSANQLAATALPLLAMAGLSSAIEIASWWTIFTTYKMLGLMNERPDFSLSISDVRKAIEAQNAEDRKKFKTMKESMKRIDPSTNQ